MIRSAGSSSQRRRSLGAVDNVDRHLGQRLRHAFGLFLRTAPLGLAAFCAAPDPGLRTGSFYSPCLTLGWLKTVPSGREEKTSWAPSWRAENKDSRPFIGPTRNKNRKQQGLVTAKVSTSPVLLPSTGLGQPRRAHFRVSWEATSPALLDSTASILS